MSKWDPEGYECLFEEVVYTGTPDEKSRNYRRQVSKSPTRDQEIPPKRVISGRSIFLDLKGFKGWRSSNRMPGGWAFYASLHY